MGHMPTAPVNTKKYILMSPAFIASHFSLISSWLSAQKSGFIRMYFFVFAGAVGMCCTMLVLPSLNHGSPASIIAIEDFLQGAYAIYLALPAKPSELVISLSTFIALPLASLGPPLTIAKYS